MQRIQSLTYKRSIVKLYCLKVLLKMRKFAMGVQGKSKKLFVLHCLRHLQTMNSRRASGDGFWLNYYLMDLILQQFQE